MKMRSIICSFLFTTLLGSASAYADDSTLELLKPGELIIATEGTDPPIVCAAQMVKSVGLKSQ